MSCLVRAPTTSARPASNRKTATNVSGAGLRGTAATKRFASISLEYSGIRRQRPETPESRLGAIRASRHQVLRQPSWHFGSARRKQKPTTQGGNPRAQSALLRWRSQQSPLSYFSYQRLRSSHNCLAYLVGGVEHIDNDVGLSSTDFGWSNQEAL